MSMNSIPSHTSIARKTYIRFLLLYIATEKIYISQWIWHWEVQLLIDCLWKVWTWAPLTGSIYCIEVHPFPKGVWFVGTGFTKHAEGVSFWSWSCKPRRNFHFGSLQFHETPRGVLLMCDFLHTRDISFCMNHSINPQCFIVGNGVVNHNRWSIWGGDFTKCLGVSVRGLMCLISRKGSFLGWYKPPLVVFHFESWSHRTP